MDQFRGLFVKLDKNNDGSISVEELHNEMKKTGIMAADQKAQTVVNNYDRNKDGRLDYDEFLSYMSDREKKWRIHFMALDKNKCGVIGQEEIIDLFKELGVNISKPNAKRIIQMMDEDSSMTVDWGEFLQHVILNPAENLGELVTSWKHTLVFDVGESRTMPLELPPDLSAGSGEWRSFVLAAGLADAVSRTLTAPIDRLKTQLQVYGSKASSQGFRELKAGGVRSMWQGNAVNVLKGTPQSTLQCLIYAQMKVYTQGWQQESLSVQQRFGLGCVSGAVAHAVFYPLEVPELYDSFVAFSAGQMSSYPLAVIRTQQQAQAFSSTSPTTFLQGFTGIYERHGIRGYYNGMGASFVRAIPCALLNYTLMKKLDTMLS
nr:calcium-binding mitochondrial carrier protein SCaMC-1-like isoform X3 [Oncorhynchus nerka]